MAKYGIKNGEKMHIKNAFTQSDDADVSTDFSTTIDSRSRTKHTQKLERWYKVLPKRESQCGPAEEESRTMWRTPTRA